MEVFGKNDMKNMLVDAAKNNKFSEKVGHNELYNLLVSRELSWQQIILDLIKSEQLDPWDIDLTLLTKKYLVKIHELEEANFFVSSKIFLAAAILLRIKSEFLVERYIKSLDEILFGKPEKKEKPEIQIDLDDVAELFPRTPLPRPKKVTLPELMDALSRAMVTEHRRIKKEINVRHAVSRLERFIPQKKGNIREKIKEVYAKILAFFSEEEREKMLFSTLAQTKEDKIPSFYSVLHLDFQKTIVLEQPKHFEEIFIYLMKTGQTADELMKDLDRKEREYAARKMRESIEEEITERSGEAIADALKDEDVVEVKENILENSEIINEDKESDILLGLKPEAS